jgi:hypothetical protein
MVEHFANGVRPAFPIQGQVWYKNVDGVDPSNPADPSLAGLYVFTPRDFGILSASNSTNTFVVAGNQLASFPIGNTFVVTGTVANDGTYNVVAASFSVNTTITVLLVPAVQGVGGNIQSSLWNSISISGAPVGDLDMGGFKIINLGTPTNPADGANKSYVDAQDALHVLKAGDTMTGPLVFSGTAGILITGTGVINMGGNKIINLGTPTLNTDATTKSYVDGQDALKVSKAGDTMSGSLIFTGFAPMDMGGNKITNLGNATAAGDALNLLTGDARYLQLTGGTLTGILTMSGAFISMGGQPIVNMQDPTNPQDAATKAYVDASVGPGSDTYVSSFTYSNGLASSSTINLTQTGPNAGVPFIVNMGHLHSTDDDQYLVPPNSDLDRYYRLFGAPGYQTALFSGAITNDGLTGLANNATVYTATITVDGSPFPITVTGSAAQTFFDLTNEINSDLGTVATSFVIDGDAFLTIASASTGSTSTIAIVDGTLFASLTGPPAFTTFAAAIPGFGSALPSGYPTLSLTNVLAGFDIVKVTNRPTEFDSSFKLNPRSTDSIVSGAVQVLIDIPIIAVDTVLGTFTVEGGDFTSRATPGSTFDVFGSSGNNGTYTILLSSFNDSNNTTTASVVETIPVSTVDGRIIDPFEPLDDNDIVTKNWIDLSIVRDVQTSTGTSSFTFGGGYQEFIFSLAGTEIDVTAGMSTGLSNDATMYRAYIFVDGVANLINVTGSTAQTFGTLITQVNADLTGATAAIVNGRLRATSASSGITSTIYGADLGATPPFPILSAVDAVTNTFTIAGNHTATFTAGKAFTVTNTPNNNGVYVTVSSSFGGGNTTITVTAVPSDQGPGGLIVINQLFSSLVNIAFDFTQPTIPQDGLVYRKGFNRLWIFVNGVKQFIDDDYTENDLYGESDVDSVTFSYVVPNGARVEFLVFKS